MADGCAICRQRSDEEIQAAYDAAPGPPAKADKANGPPSAPPAPQDSNSASHDGEQYSFTTAYIMHLITDWKEEIVLFPPPPES